MAFYAHATIEHDGKRYTRGDEVPDTIDGFEELVEGGSVSEEKYDPEVDKVGPPDTVEIEGVVYVKASDGAEESAESSV